MSKIIQSVGIFGKTLDDVIGNLGKKALTDLALHLAEDILPKLAKQLRLY